VYYSFVQLVGLTPGKPSPRMSRLQAHNRLLLYTKPAEVTVLGSIIEEDYRVYAKKRFYFAAFSC
jgi:hypothetical protein